MTYPGDYVFLAEECEALAAAAQSQVNRDMLLAAAARWRRMANVALGLEQIGEPDETP